MNVNYSIHCFGCGKPRAQIGKLQLTPINKKNTMQRCYPLFLILLFAISSCTETPDKATTETAALRQMLTPLTQPRVSWHRI